MIHIFIINSFSGNRQLSRDIRNQLKKHDDMNYFVFNTLDVGKEEDIARKMCRYFKGEKIRFYCCGGSGTMRNMMNGIGNFKNIEVAFFPCGFNNDFLKCFGDKEEFFYDIEYLIDGVAIPVDYIKTNHGVALNTCSLGIDSKMVEFISQNRHLDGFGNRMPHALGFIRSIAGSQTRKLRINIDKDTIFDDISEILIGNGCMIGGNLHISSDTAIDDGYAEYGIAIKKSRLGIMRLLLAMMKRSGSVNKLANIGSGAYFEIRAFDEMPISMNLDGEIIHGDDYWRIEIVQGGMNFVVPRQVFEN